MIELIAVNSQLEIAIEIAVKAHKGQLDKAGMPYILHPLRVMTNVSKIEEKIVAVLHDVVEDTDVTFKYLIEKGIDKDLVNSIKLLTKNKDYDYIDYIKNIASDGIARNVKLADLKDNSDITRLPVITEKDIERLNKYKMAITYLSDIKK